MFKVVKNVLAVFALVTLLPTISLSADPTVVCKEIITSSRIDLDIKSGTGWERVCKRKTLSVYLEEDVTPIDREALCKCIITVTKKPLRKGVLYGRR